MKPTLRLSLQGEIFRQFYGMAVLLPSVSITKMKKKIIHRLLYCLAQTRTTRISFADAAILGSPRVQVTGHSVNDGR